MNVTIRNEQADDIDSIARLVEVAFRDAPHSSHTEQFIVNALRRCNQLSISLVAVEGDDIVGHVAVSPVTISSRETGWYGLGPISVWPNRQRQGIGSKLMQAALAELQCLRALGCVVLGEPAYYGRFRFKTCAHLELPDVPQQYFQALALAGRTPTGIVCYHAAFEATE